MDLKQFIRIIQNMDRTPFKPHRYLALMAALDIIENQENPKNEFYYDDNFKNYFIKYFCLYHNPNDNCNSFKPFFHRKNAKENDESFWFLIPNTGREAELQRLSTVRGIGELSRIVDYAKLDDAIFETLRSDQKYREKVRDEIIKCLQVNLNQA